MRDSEADEKWRLHKLNWDNYLFDRCERELLSTNKIVLIPAKNNSEILEQLKKEEDQENGG